MDNNKKVRFIVDLPPKVAKALLEMSKNKNLDIDEVVRKSVCLYHYIQENNKSNSRLLLETNGEFTQLIFT